MLKPLTFASFILGVLAFATALPTMAATEHGIGKADAPITMEEYVSLTCSHCADYYLQVLPKIKERYVDTGKVRVILKDFPTDGVSLKASVLAHCMPEDQYLSFVNVLFKNQMQWAFGSRSPDEQLVQYAQLGGLAKDAAEACLKDTGKMDAIVKARTQATETYSINATPSFVIRGGSVKDYEQLVGARPFEDFAAVFDRRLAPPAAAEPAKAVPEAKAPAADAKPKP